MNRHERRRTSAVQKKTVKWCEIFFLSSVNIETVLAAAEAGDEAANEALSCGKTYVDSGQHHCLNCLKVKFAFDNLPMFLVILRSDDETQTAGFCHECVEDHSFVAHLEKLGIKREEFMLPLQ